MKHSENKRIIILLAGLILLFLSCIIYLTYFYFFQAEEVKRNPANRQELYRRGAD